VQAKVLMVYTGNYLNPAQGEEVSNLE